MRRGDARPLGLPFAASAALHVLAAAALVLLRPDPPPPLPPIYEVNLVAAPPGPRQMGIVAPPATVPTVEAPPPRRAETPDRMMPAPVPRPTPTRRQTPPATQSPVTTPREKAPPVSQQQRAGGGEEGGRGTDVANVRTEGIAFPFPGYLQNIVRQVALRFQPGNPNAPLSADVQFLIHRDGRVSSIRILKRSGVYAFDLEAQGAIEAAAEANAFGPLPAEFTDDVLPVVFSFDPRIVR